MLYFSELKNKYLKNNDFLSHNQGFVKFRPHIRDTPAQAVCIRANKDVSIILMIYLSTIFLKTVKNSIVRLNFDQTFQNYFLKNLSTNCVYRPDSRQSNGGF